MMRKRLARCLGFPLLALLDKLMFWPLVSRQGMLVTSFDYSYEDDDEAVDVDRRDDWTRMSVRTRKGLPPRRKKR